MSLHGQRVLVMGGSSGIGEATAARFAAAGADVVITGRNPEKLRAAADRIEKVAEGQTVARAVDGASDDQVAAFFAEDTEYDHVVLSLGGSLGAGAFGELDLAVLRQAFDEKYWAQLRVLQAALPKLRPSASVTIVTAASARAALPGTAGLAGVNGALEAAVAPLAAELAPIRVNAVSPAIVDTPWWDAFPAEQRSQFFAMARDSYPVGRIGEPDDVAQAIYALATNGFITGTVLECTGGSTLARA